MPFRFNKMKKKAMRIIRKIIDTQAVKETIHLKRQTGTNIFSSKERQRKKTNGRCNNKYKGAVPALPRVEPYRLAILSYSPKPYTLLRALPYTIKNSNYERMTAEEGEEAELSVAIGLYAYRSL